MKNRALKTYIFYCSNNLEADQFSGLCLQHYGDTIKIISLPCSGKVDIPYLIKAFETGADSVAIVTCKKNECRHFEGNLRAHKRAEAVEALLEEIGFVAGRIAVFECGKQDTAEVLSEIKKFIERVKNLPATNTQSDTANKQENTVA
jgi:F420-non-reducing hydrogenase iron-sulfur subunit